MKDFTGKRTIPGLPEEAESLAPFSPTVGRFDFSLLTPMFGGGVETRRIDPITPVRVSEIRGHLRYWWRLRNRGPGMAEKEAAIWGSTEGAGPARIEVSTLRKQQAPCGAWVKTGESKEQFEFTAGPDYFLFPFRPGKRGDEIVTCWSAMEFQLFVDTDKESLASIAPALQLWANFGGLGSRTRRGCGGLFCERLALPGLGRFPGLRIFAGPPQPDVRAAWNLTANVYRSFRQQGVGRKGQGRSHWPEPDSLRAAIDVGNPNHMESTTLKDAREQPYFPRAEFGLPIIYRFKSSGKEERLDNDASLSGNLTPVVGGRQLDRMASPLIFRAVKLKSGAIVPTIVCLPVSLPDSLHYKFEKYGEIGDERLAPQKFPAQHFDPDLFLPNAPILSRLSRGNSIIDAFLSYATTAPHSFQEVV